MALMKTCERLTEIASPLRAFGSGSRIRSIIERHASPAASSSAKMRANAGDLLDRVASSEVQHVVVLGMEPSMLALANKTPRAANFLFVDRHERLANSGVGAGLATLENELSWYGDVAELERDLQSVFGEGERQAGGTVVILNEVLERVEDPRPLLWFCRRHLLRSPQNRVLIRHVERPPSVGSLPRPEHFREWSRSELQGFLEGSGFSAVSDSGVLSLSLRRESFDEFLRAHRLPTSALREVLLLPHMESGPSYDGLSTYASERARLLGASYAIVATSMERPQTYDGWVSPEDLGLSVSELRTPERAHQLVQQLLFLYPELERIEVPDLGGAGARILQARASHLLPSTLEVEVVCHGATPYLERHAGLWGGLARLPQSSEEKLSLTLADRVLLPSTTLAELYAETGMFTQPDGAVPRGYPFTGFDNMPEGEVLPANCVLFFGRRSAAKGFPAFVDAVRLVLQGRDAALLKRVLVIGERDPSSQEADRLLEQIGQKVELVELATHRNGALDLLRRYAGSAVCIVPYRTAAYPYAVLEAVASGCELVVSRQSMLDDHIPALQARPELCSGSTEELAAALVRSLTRPLPERKERVASLRSAFRRMQSGINALHREAHLKRADRPLPSTQMEKRGTLSVMVTCFNTELRLVRDLLWTLNQQSLAPKKVVVVDDGSKGDYSDRLEELLTAECAHPFELVRHEQNLGLPAARNTALRRIDTDYVVNLDSDDLAKNDFLRLYARQLDREPGVSAVSSYCDFFDDESEWNFAGAFSSDAYRPIGLSSVLGLLENCFGHANSAYRVDRLRQVGGWDSSDASMWEDWGLFLQLVTSGHKLSVIPMGTSGYRYRPNSMARSASRFEAQRRLARSHSQLPRFEAFQLESVLRVLNEQASKSEEVPHGSVTPISERQKGWPHVAAESRLQTSVSLIAELLQKSASLEEENRELKRELETLRYEHQRLRSHLGRSVIGFIEQYPELYDGLRHSLDSFRVRSRGIQSRMRELKHLPGSLRLSLTEARLLFSPSNKR